MTDAATEELTLDISHHMPFPPERVFDAWLDPALLARFMIAADGMSVPEASSDAKVGGRFMIMMRTPDARDLPHQGEYLAIDRPNRLQFTWQSWHSPDDSVVTLDFMPDGDGTLVRLHQIRFASEDSRNDHVGGWTRILATLEAALGS